MSRSEYYSSVSPLKVTRIPKAFLSISCIGKPDRPIDENSGYYERVLRSFSIGEYQRTINMYSCRSEITMRETNDAYYAREYVNDIRKKYTSVWIVCDGLLRCLTLLSFWDLFDSGHITLPGLYTGEKVKKDDIKGIRGYVSIGGKTEIIVCKWGESTLRFVALSNYGDMTLADIFRSNDDELETISIRNGEDSINYPDVLDIQRNIGLWYRKMLIKWKNDDNGVWKSTAPQLSHTIYRKKFLKARLTTVRSPQLDRLERASLFGGRSDIWFSGDAKTWSNKKGLYLKGYKKSENVYNVSGITRLDISSMYPYIFSQYSIPGQCFWHETENADKEIGNAVKSGYIVIAAVRINTSIPEYPVRINEETTYKSTVLDQKVANFAIHKKNSVEYGIGEYDTVLIGPELERAYLDGHIVRCYEYACYLPSEEYMEFMQYLINKRYEYKLSKDKYAEDMYKLLGNSFGGKLAQKNCGWKEVKESICMPCNWGEWFEVDADSGEITKYRAIAGYPQFYSNEEYSPKGRPCVWSFVCAVGRYIMRSIRELLPPKSVLQQDTDGLYVTDDAVEILVKNGMLGQDGPGKLRMVSTHNHARFYDARHYIVDGIPVMSGLTTGFDTTDGERFKDTKEKGAFNRVDNNAPSSIATVIRSVSLHCQHSQNRNSQNGWLEPYRVNNKSSWVRYEDDPMATLFRSPS